MAEFVHLHLHTEYSLLDGACRIHELMAALKAMGQTAVAITDHGALFGAVEFYKAAVAAGIRPIIGCEVYVAPRSRHGRSHGVDDHPYHLVLLCENNTGYQNLMRLVSAAQTEGFYGKPRVDRELLERWHEGLIALSGCLAGEVAQKLLAGDRPGAEAAARWYQSVFGAEGYYIELQNHGLPDQLRLLPLLRSLAAETGIPLVATNDCHYLTKEDRHMQRVLLCLQTGTTLTDAGGLAANTGDQMYVKSADEMSALFADTPQAIENTLRIAERCRVSFTFGELKLPAFPLAGDHAAFLRQMSEEGLRRLYGPAPPAEVTDRLQYELSVIEKMGYVDYYLIVWDFIRYAREQGIPVGPGRGSGAGSLVAYCIGITGVDPIRYQLLFERFLNPERVSMPDFDIDFCYVRREEIVAYLVRKYGAGHVAQIVTFGTLAAKAAVRDVARVMDLPYKTGDKIARLVPGRLKITLREALEESPELAALYEQDEEARRVIDMAMRIEGMPRHASTHPAGVVITRRPVVEYVPLARGDDSPVTQFPMTTLEELGLLKIDLLGLRNLTVMETARRTICETEPDFSLENLPEDDPAVYEMLAKGDSLGVFQFESAGMKRLLTRLRPTTIEDLTAALALYRPGPMKSIQTYLDNRRNPERIQYLIPALEPILRVTYGCLVYQEQVMQVCRTVAGYSYGHADVVRRAMAKKKHDVMERERASFVAGAVERGTAEETANRIFDGMVDFASYAFNKSHAVAYAMVAYKTAYLKCRYPVAYFAALLTSVIDSTDKMAEYLHECALRGIRVLPPDVNRSGRDFTVHRGDIVFGLLAVKNIGAGLIDAILQSRQTGGPFTDLADFCRRLQGRELNRRAVESLIRSGAMDCFGVGRRPMLLAVDSLLAALQQERRDNVAGQLGLFDAPGARQQPPVPPAEEFDRETLLRMEKETVGLYLSGHPLQGYRTPGEKTGARIAHFTGEAAAGADGGRVSLLCMVNGLRTALTKKNETMAYATAEDETGSMELVLFPKTYQSARPLLTEGAVCRVTGRLSLREERPPALIAESVDRPGDPAKAAVQTPAPAAAEPPAPGRLHGLHLLLDSTECEAAERCFALLSLFPGDTPVYLKLRQSGKRLLVPRERFITPNEPMLRELRSLLGEGGVYWEP